VQLLSEKYSFLFFVFDMIKMGTMEYSIIDINISFISLNYWLANYNHCEGWYIGDLRTIIFIILSI